MEIKRIDELKKRFCERFPDVEISENVISDGRAYVVILRGGLDSANPKQYMDSAVSEYVSGLMYNEFIEVFLDNFWVRVLVFNFNEITNWRKFSNKLL